MRRLFPKGLKEKLISNIETAKQFDMRVYVCYCNNNLVATYVAKNMDSAYDKMKFNFTNNYNFIEVMELKNKDTLNSRDVFDIVKQLFASDFKI